MKMAERIRKTSKAVALIGINALLLLAAGVNSYAQQPISTSDDVDDVEVVDTMTVSDSEIIATVSVDNDDYSEIVAVEAQAVLYAGSKAVAVGELVSGTLSAVSSVTASITAGLACTLQGWYGEEVCSSGESVAALFPINPNRR
jgi:LEA14-like dessication related protein